ncbi:14244_t:CDS:2, partial [Cetraspora pellucida]
GSNNVDSESSTEESENNPRQLKAGKNNNFTKVCAARIQSQITLHSSFAIQAGTDQIKVMRNMRNIYFLIQHNLSTNIFESLCKLSEIQHGEDQNQFECGTEILNLFDNNQLADNDEQAQYGSYQNNVSAREFIESIGRVIEQEIFQKLRKSDGWSLMLDESNTVSAEKTLAIVSKHLIAPAKPIYRFLGLILLTDGTANTIIAEINRFFQAKHISYDDLMHICTDGASTMIGSRVGVATQLKNKNPFILEHHCISYKLALAAKDAAKQVEEFKQYKKIVHNIYSYFSRSPERMMHLKMTEKNLGDPHFTVLNIIETRWLSLSNVIQNLHQILSSIIDALLEDSYKNTVAEALYNSINETFIITTKFFADILGTLRRMNLLFQKNHITIHEVKTQLDVTIYTIQLQFLGTDKVKPSWKTHLRRYMNDHNIITDELPIIITKFAHASIELLEKRFPDRIQVNAFHIFDPIALPVENSEFQKYSEDEIEILGNFYGQNKHKSGNLFPAILDSENLNHEWLSLISILVNLPLTNAVVERIFSRQNLIKTKLRNRMSIFTLNYLLLISFNGPKLEDFNFQLAYQE